MKKVGEQLRRIWVWTALFAAILVALPAAAGAQFMDPVLDQYAPSSQQIDKKVKGDDKGGGEDGGGDSGGAGAGDVQTDPATAPGDDGSDSDDGTGGGSAGGAAGGGDGTGGNTGNTGASGGDAPGGDGSATRSGSEASGLDARLLTDVPLTRFDFLAFAIAIGLLIGTGLVLRRLSHSPHVEG